MGNVLTSISVVSPSPDRKDGGLHRLYPKKHTHVFQGMYYGNSLMLELLYSSVRHYISLLYRYRVLLINIYHMTQVISKWMVLVEFSRETVRTTLGESL